MPPSMQRARVRGVPIRSRLAPALLGLLTASCGTDDAPREAPRAPIDPRFAEIVQRLQPFEGRDAEPVLSVRGIPIRRGDFRELVDYLRRIGAPDLAPRVLHEAAFVEVLLPRALHLHRADAATVDAVISSLPSLRSTQDLVAWTALLQSYGTVPLDANAEQDIAPGATTPEMAVALLSLMEVDRIAGPIWAREGVFAFQLTHPLPASAGPRQERRVRTGGCFWVRTGREHPTLREAMENAIAEAEIVVLDEAFRSAVPERLP